ncbi:2911_t:CDS:2 [Funneliformis caledonium]|uniref:2911_t:CDS:1 n=1 Tax=Funneliformis caledonium TaxID=1117310 RepID=A0A9N9HCE0_9GLOM|nr:2911_t:CDS:2 [Funneliformis caledonium]
MNGLFKIKLGHASHIMKLVEELKEKRESSPMSVEVITATEFEKFRKSTRNQLENLNKRINITSEFNKLFSDVKDAQNDIREIKNRLLI